jgi:hypothetical protein
MAGAASLQALKSTSRMKLYNSLESLSIVIWTGVVLQSFAIALRFSIAAAIGDWSFDVVVGDGGGVAGGAGGAAGLAGGSGLTSLFMCRCACT